MATVSSLVTMGMGSGPGGMVTMGMGPSMAIATVTAAVPASTSAAWGPWGAWVGKKKYPWLDENDDIYPNVYVVRASLIDINGDEIIHPTAESVTQAYYEKRKPRVYATFKWAKAIKASINNIFINALRVFRGKEIEDEDFYE